MKNISKILILLFIAFVIFGFRNSIVENNSEKFRSDEELKKIGMQLINDRCFSCHNPDMEADTRLAPPMFMVKRHYFDDKTTKDEFVNDIVNFVLNPNEEDAVMMGAIRKFGLMPQSSFLKEEVTIIAGYIFETDLRSDGWYAEWGKFLEEQKEKELKNK